MHWLFRVDGPACRTVELAKRPSTPAELAAHQETERAKAHQNLTNAKLDVRLAKIDALTPAQVPQVLIETRGEGGFTVTAPSAGRTHPTGRPWTVLSGGLGTLPMLSVEERDALYAVSRMLDQMPAKPEPATAMPPQSSRPAGGRPGDDYNARASWDDIITPHGWQRSKHYGGNFWGWTRPGKSPYDGISATTGLNEADNLYVFSTSTEFETRTAISKFAAYTALEHSGDYKAAARSLARDGYGDQTGFEVFGLAAQPGQPPPPGTPPATPAAGDEHITPSDTTPPQPGKPELNVGNVATMADWLQSSIGTGHLAGFFRRGPDIVHTAREGAEGYVDLRDHDAHASDFDGPAQVRTVRRSHLASHVQLTHRCYKLVKRGTEWAQTPAVFPIDAARVCEDMPEQMDHLRRLNGVVHSPVFRTDGTLLAAPGYDPATGLLHLPERGLVVPPVAAAPTQQDRHQAVALLDQMTAGFNFITPHDRATYYGLLLTPLLRTIAPPPYKLGAITSPGPGSGKTLLATLARIIHGGVFRAEMPEDAAELRKQVTAMLTVTTGPVIHFDNVTGVLRSSTLAGLLTSATWGDRPLGATAWVGTPNDRLWVITGNNVALGGDLLRRTVWVSIDPRVPHPEQRTGFAITDLEGWVTQRRGELLHALLTLIRAWVVDGRPPAPSRSSDGYATWVDTVTAILAHAGVPGTFGDQSCAPQELGTEDDEWADFLSVVHAALGDAQWSVKDLLAKVDPMTHDGFPDNPYKPIKLTDLPDQLQDKARRAGSVQALGRSLGMWLRNRAGRWAGGYTVRSVGTGRARELFWQIEVTR